MKKFMIFFLVLVLTAGSAAAQDTGFTAGLEFGIDNIGEANEGEMTPYIMPIIIYENVFLDGALDVYAELNYTVWLTEDTPQELYVDLLLGYNIGLGDASTLSIILENEFDTISISPDSGYIGAFTPAVQFTQGLDFGDLYAKIGLPIGYTDGSDETFTGLDFTFGLSTGFGLGLEAIIKTLIAPDEISGYFGFEVIVSYGNGPIYCEVDVEVPEKPEYGITITPEFDYSIGNLTIYGKIVFEDVGSDSKDPVVSPGIGVKYSF